MGTRKRIGELVSGLSIPQQYLCVSLETFGDRLFVSTTFQNNDQSISVNPIFVGYKPLIFALSDSAVVKEQTLCLTFNHADVVTERQWQRGRTSQHALAKILLEKIPIEFKKLSDIALFRGVSGEHSFINEFYQWSNRLREFVRPKKMGNISLPGNLHDMVRIAYSIPRVIALVSFAENGLMNLFPTDLHGKVNDQFYLSSLRIGGKAQQQIERVRKIVISEVKSESFKSVYDLGKNHMKDPEHFESFSLSDERSKYLKYPLPKHVLRYYELEVCEHADVGIHRIYLYKILRHTEVANGKTLAHIHQYYGQWRKDHHLSTEYLLR